MPQNVAPQEQDPERDDVAAQIAQQTLAKRGAQYATEVRRLLDAALALMSDLGTTASPRVADIVAAAGLSNDAFYRHFASKEALVAAILEDGTVRLRSYLEHQMAKASTPEGKVRRFVEGVMAQAADDDIAATTRAVLWNGGAVSDSVPTRPTPALALAALLAEPFAELGSARPGMDAELVAHAAVGMMSHYLWEREQPTRADMDHIIEFCLRVVGPAPRAKARRSA
jgi:AcrR family transcriptional regulator